MARAKKPRILRVYDLGPEPTDARGTSKLIRAYQWYNYEFSQKEGRKFVDTYLKANVSKDDQSLFARLTDIEIAPTYMWIARMVTTGVNLELTTLQWFADKHAELLALARAKDTTSVVVPVKVRKIIPRSASVIADLDDVIDTAYATKQFDFNTYTFLQRFKLTRGDIDRLIDYYEPQANELAEAAVGSDDQLTEAYRFLPKLQIRRRRDFVFGIIADIKRMINNKVGERKPRKKRVKSASELVKNVKFQKASVDLKLSSVNPEKIIGASQLWLYNTKYNQLGVLNSLEGGFSIKGTTIENVCDATSKMKRLRKPKEQLSTFMTGGKVQTRKFLDTVSSKEYFMKGRLNANTIILKVS